MDVAWRAVAAFLTLEDKIHGSENGSLVDHGLVIERLRVRVPAGAGGEFLSGVIFLVFVCVFFFSEVNFCSESYFGIRSTPVVPQ